MKNDIPKKPDKLKPIYSTKRNLKEIDEEPSAADKTGAKKAEKDEKNHVRDQIGKVRRNKGSLADIWNLDDLRIDDSADEVLSQIGRELRSKAVTGARLASLDDREQDAFNKMKEQLAELNTTKPSNEKRSKSHPPSSSGGQAGSSTGGSKKSSSKPGKSKAVTENTKLVDDGSSTHSSVNGAPAANGSAAKDLSPS